MFGFAASTSSTLKLPVLVFDLINVTRILKELEGLGSVLRLGEV